MYCITFSLSFLAASLAGIIVAAPLPSFGRHDVSEASGPPLTIYGTYKGYNPYVSYNGYPSATDAEAAHIAKRRTRAVGGTSNHDLTIYGTYKGYNPYVGYNGYPSAVDGEGSRTVRDFEAPKRDNNNEDSQAAKHGLTERDIMAAKVDRRKNDASKHIVSTEADAAKPETNHNKRAIKVHDLAMYGNDGDIIKLEHIKDAANTLAKKTEKRQIGEYAWYPSYKPYTSYKGYPEGKGGDAAKAGMAEGVLCWLHGSPCSPASGN